MRWREGSAGEAVPGYPQLRRARAIRLATAVLAFWPWFALAITIVEERTVAWDLFWLWMAIPTWAAWLFFVFHASLAGTVPQAKVRLWVVVLLLAHMAAMPFYWYYYVGRRRA